MSTFKLLQKVANYFASLLHHCETATNYLIDKGYIIISWDNRGHSVQFDSGGKFHLPTHIYIKFVLPKQEQGKFSCYGFSLCPPDVETTGMPVDYIPFGYISKATMPRQREYFYDLADFEIQNYVRSFMTDPPAEMPCMTFTSADRDVLNVPHVHGIDSLSLIPFRLDTLRDDSSVVALLERALGEL